MHQRQAGAGEPGRVLPQRYFPADLAEFDTHSERPEFADYPELDVLLSVALDSVVGPFGLAENEHGMRIVEDATVTALVTAYAPVALAARRTAAHAEKTRLAEASAVAEAAQLLASHAQETATRLRLRGDATARQAAADAGREAEREAAAVPVGMEVEAAEEAAITKRLVQQQAATAVAEWAEVAAMTRYGVGLAVTRVAAAADVAAMAAELETLDTAVAVETNALDSCYRIGLAAAVKAAARVMSSDH